MKMSNIFGTCIFGNSHDTTRSQDAADSDGVLPNRRENQHDHTVIVSIAPKLKMIDRQSIHLLPFREKHAVSRKVKLLLFFIFFLDFTEKLLSMPASTRAKFSVIGKAVRERYGCLKLP